MGKLFLVPTPIGNLGDMTFRGVEVLSQVAYILCEDTRISKRLLNHYNIENKLVPYHSANEHKVTSRHINFLRENQADVALISDAGTPGLSDPGFFMVRQCKEDGVEVECLPGATAFLPALIESGLPTDKFCFEGFLPHKKGRKKRLQQLEQETRTLIFYESPYRIQKLLSQLLEYMDEDRQASISRELSKVHGESFSGSLKELSNRLEENTTIKGEFVIIVAGNSRK